ncbi:MULTISPECIES: Lrp/AsnC family transcriptional regulator [Rhizobium]|uniref:Lrp/AsnC family transcriptional regulator n=1 Tax=Rhizobium TaxID=379 RepID=UPI002E219220
MLSNKLVSIIDFLCSENLFSRVLWMPCRGQLIFVRDPVHEQQRPLVPLRLPPQTVRCSPHLALTTEGVGAPLPSLFSNLFQRRDIAFSVKAALYSAARYALLFHGEASLAKFHSPVELDSFDLAILRILQRDNSTPQRTIGESVGLSAPAVQRRIKRMQDAGIIVRNVAVVDPVKVGRPITIIAHVQVHSESIDLIEDAKQNFTAAPEVQQCYYVTGEMDFILVLITENMMEYERLTKRLFFENNNVKRFQTFVVMNSVKASLDVPF